jgi:Spy/CpxP family protein refolding chaperone
MFVRSMLATLALALTLPLAASAQTAPPADAPPAPAAAAPHAHHPRYMAAIRSLALTSDQKQQIRGFANERKQANVNADEPTKRANAKKFRSEVDGVLTDDQRAQLQTLLATPH